MLVFMHRCNKLVFVQEPLVRRLMTWAAGDQQPLASYAIGLLGAAMEMQEIAANFKENNAVLVRIFSLVRK